MLNFQIGLFTRTHILSAKVKSKSIAEAKKSIEFQNGISFNGLNGLVGETICEWHFESLYSYTYALIIYLLIEFFCWKFDYESQRVYLLPIFLVVLLSFYINYCIEWAKINRWKRFNCWNFPNPKYFRLFWRMFISTLAKRKKMFHTRTPLLFHIRVARWFDVKENLCECIASIELIHT